MKQNESFDEVLPLSSGMIDECSVLLSGILTFIFTSNVVDVLKQPFQRVDMRKAIGLFCEGLKLLPIHHPDRLPACSSVADTVHRI